MKLRKLAALLLAGLLMLSMCVGCEDLDGCEDDECQEEQEGPWVRGDQQRIHNKSGGNPNGEAPHQSPPQPPATEPTLGRP